MEASEKLFLVLHARFRVRPGQKENNNRVKNDRRRILPHDTNDLVGIIARTHSFIRFRDYRLDTVRLRDCFSYGTDRYVNVVKFSKRFPARRLNCLPPPPRHAYTAAGTDRFVCDSVAFDATPTPVQVWSRRYASSAFPSHRVYTYDRKHDRRRDAENQRHPAAGTVCFFDERLCSHKEITAENARRDRRVLNALVNRHGGGFRPAANPLSCRRRRLPRRVYKQ